VGNCAFAYLLFPFLKRMAANRYQNQSKFAPPLYFIRFICVSKWNLLALGYFDSLKAKI
jgi:hypothetical protein